MPSAGRHLVPPSCSSLLPGLRSAPRATTAGTAPGYRNHGRGSGEEKPGARCPLSWTGAFPAVAPSGSGREVAETTSQVVEVLGKGTRPPGSDRGGPNGGGNSPPPKSIEIKNSARRSAEESPKKKKFRPNRELRNLAEIAKKLSVKAGSVAGVGGLCLKHQEPLKLFCQEDRAAICVVCDRSHAHRAHSVAPIEEAAQECKEQIQNKLKSLKDERERLQGLKLTGEKRSQKYLQQTRAERWKTMLVFKQLQQFQDEQERLLLTWLEEVENQIVRTQMEDNRKISVEISHLGNLIRELEGMNPQPENKSLQDARNALTRCDARTLQQLTEKFPRVEKSLKDFSQKNIVLKEALRKFKESLPVELDVQWANVTLDPDTANPHLVLSEDRRSVRWDETPQDLPSNPQRFDTYCSVLGCEGFTVGRHYWEAQLGSRGFWAVGVARDSAWRKGWINLDPSQGIWAVGICGDRFQAFTSFEMVQPLNGRPRTLRVSLDYEKGRVAFFDADNETLAFAFPPASFNGEKILPFFWLWESRIQLAP